jgi:hypothetical protein
MLRLSLAAGLAALALTPTAFAYPVGESHATLAAPASKGTEVVVDSRIWRCDGVNCAAYPNDSDIRHKPVLECRNVARSLGKFTAYTTGDVVLTDAQLAECAAGAK